MAAKNSAQSERVHATKVPKQRPRNRLAGLLSKERRTGGLSFSIKKRARPNPSAKLADALSTDKQPRDKIR